MLQNRKFVNVSASTVLVLLAAVLLSGSQVLAQSKSSTKSVDSLDAVIKELTKIREQVQGSMESLTALTSAGAKDLTKNFKEFSKQVDGMAQTQQAATKRAEELKARREEYLAEWQKKMGDVTSPEVKAHMETRQAEVRKTFESLQPPAQAVREAFPSYLSDLKDIQSMLSVDLSQSGVTSAAPIAQKATTSGTTVVTNLDALLASLTQVRDQVAPKAKG